MSKRKRIFIIAVVAVIAVTIAGIVIAITASNQLGFSEGPNNLDKFNVDLPDFQNVYASKEEATKNGDGWYQTMDTNFEDGKMPENWHASPHGKRNYEFWCENMVHFEEKQCVIYAAKLEDNACSICPPKGYFTSGIETRKMVDGKSVPTWQQAFGYFEARVKVPHAEGMWTAFWLQSDFQRKIGNDGRDGTEMDVYESVFTKYPSMAGQALLYDGYGEHGQVEDFRADVGYNLYEGYHTYGLKWSPEGYVWYVDRKPVYASDFGGVSRVPEFLRLTAEIREGGKWGPHGYKLKALKNTKEDPAKFYIDYVKVYQNTTYEPFIQSDSDFPGVLDPAN